MRHTVSLPLLRFSAFATGLSATLSFCGQPQKERPTSESVESKINIVGGRSTDADTADARRISTVALTTDLLNAGRNRSASNKHLLDQGRSFCTATIIAPRALMTAAHCIQEFNPQTNSKSSAFILPSTDDFIAFFGRKVSIDGEWNRAAKVIPHPDWNPALTLQPKSDKPAHDIGLILLDEDVPAGYKPVAIAELSLPIQIDDPVTLVGYGVTRSRANNNTGTLREVQVPLKEIDERSQRLGVGQFMKGACAGDSGGPMYFQDKQGQWWVIGVTSAGIEILQNCIGLENSYTDARSHKNWIRSTLAAQGITIK